MAKTATLAVQHIPLGQLRPHPRNYQAHPPAQIAKLAASLKRFGQRKNIVAWQQEGFLYTIAGHGLVEAAQSIKIPALLANVFPADTPEDEVLGYMVADNETARWAEPDLAQLEALIQEQLDAGYPLESVGYTLDELEALTQQLEQEASAGNRRAIDDPSGGGDDFDTSGAETRCKLGELWQLGRHRLLCGDSTKAEDVARLMEGEKAALVVTSPPYTDQREYGLGSFDWDALMRGVSEQLSYHLSDTSHVLINLGTSHKDGAVDMYWLDWLAYCKTLGLPLYGWYIWDKGAGMPGDWNGRLAPAHEFFFHFKRGKTEANKWIETKDHGPRSTPHQFRQADGSLRDATSPDKIGQAWKVPDSVIRIGREAARGIHTANHPAVYPVALPAFVMETWSSEGDAVYEPFMGSGTTLIACERLDRRCYGLEIEPRYCDVILARWEAETGEKAVRL